PWAAGVGTTGSALGATYLPPMYKHIVSGPLKNPKNRQLPALTRREVAALVPILALTLLIGIYPRFFLQRIEPTVDYLLSRLERAGATRYVTRPAKPESLAALLPERLSR